jgi:hypothetical protein
MGAHFLSGDFQAADKLPALQVIWFFTWVLSRPIPSLFLNRDIFTPIRQHCPIPLLSKTSYPDFLSTPPCWQLPQLYLYHLHCPCCPCYCAAMMFGSLRSDEEALYATPLFQPHAFGWAAPWLYVCHIRTHVALVHTSLSKKCFPSSCFTTIFQVFCFAQDSGEALSHAILAD